MSNRNRKRKLKAKKTEDLLSLQNLAVLAVAGLIGAQQMGVQFRDPTLKAQSDMYSELSSTSVMTCSLLAKSQFLTYVDDAGLTRFSALPFGQPIKDSRTGFAYPPKTVFGAPTGHLGIIDESGILQSKGQCLNTATISQALARYGVNTALGDDRNGVWYSAPGLDMTGDKTPMNADDLLSPNQRVFEDGEYPEDETQPLDPYYVHKGNN